MKKLFLFVFPVFFIQSFTTAQDKESQYIQWFGEDSLANSLVWRGMDHMMNIEFEKAVAFFQAALDMDPTLFAPHVALTNFINDEVQREKHKAEAKRLVKGKNEVSQMFVSTLDIPWGPDGRDKWRESWAKMNELAYDGPFVNMNYARTIEGPEAQIAYYEKLLAREEMKDRGTGYIHNMLGYLYYRTDRKEKAKSHFEKYIELRPDGYNPYDSMGEFYKNEGDYKKALEYYKMAVSMYPMANNANEEVEDLEEMIEDMDTGNLIYIAAEYVYPEYVEDYMKWGKEYKAVAEKTGFKDFWVTRGDQAFYYGVNVGKEMEDYEDYNEAWDEWFEENPELGAMWDKYKHTVYKSEKLLWRHMPEYSYNPDEGNDGPNTYSRIYYAHVKYGHEEAAMEVMKNFRDEWEKHNVKEGFNVYSNIFGKEDNCIAIVTNYQNMEAWMADEQDVMSKVGMEKIQSMMKEWNKHIKFGENAERWPQPDISHRSAD